MPAVTPHNLLHSLNPECCTQACNCDDLVGGIVGIIIGIIIGVVGLLLALIFMCGIIPCCCFAKDVAQVAVAQPGQVAVAQPQQVQMVAQPQQAVMAQPMMAQPQVAAAGVQQPGMVVAQAVVQ